MLLWVPKHTGADAELTVLGFEDIVIDASLTAVPEGIVVGKLVEADWHIAQSCIHLHHRIATGQVKYLGMRPAQTSQCEGVVLNTLRNA